MKSQKTKKKYPKIREVSERGKSEYELSIFLSSNFDFNKA